MRRRGVRFTDKKKSVQARVSIVMSCLSVAWLNYSMIHAYHFGDRSGNQLGAFGMLALILQLLSFGYACRAIKEEDVFPVAPRVALLLAVLFLLAWFLVYGLGWYLFLNG